MPPSAHPNGSPARTLQLVRSAISVAVLLFIAVAAQVRKPPPFPRTEVAYAAVAVAVLALGAIFVFRRQYAAATTRAQRATYCIIGWAMGEGPALIGVVSYFLGNSFTTAVPGLLVFVTSLALFPIPEDGPA